MIPHSNPSISDDDAERVARVVRSGRLAQGPEVAAFERELAARLGVQDAAAVASGTAALELALGALGVGAGDEVLIPTYVCDALHHAVRRAGATPVLVDADPATHSLSAKDALARRTRRTRAVIVPHAFGLAADLEPFQALEVPVIEDCAQALGAELAGGRAAGRARTASRLPPIRARARPRSRRRRRSPRRARRGRAAAGVPSRPSRARPRRVSRGGPAVGGIAVDPLLSSAHRRRGRARRAGARDGARGMPPGGTPPGRVTHVSRPMAETLPDSTPAALGATLARGVVLVALMLPPVRRL